MPRFRYRMQSILDLKLKTEGQARMEFGAAQAALNEEQAKLQALVDRKNAYIAEAVEMRSGRLSAVDIRAHDAYITSMDGLIEQQMRVIARAEVMVEQARLKLTKEMQERKMYERLREKKWEQYLLEEKDAEFKDSDERTSFTYGEKVRSGE